MQYLEMKQSEITFEEVINLDWTAKSVNIVEKNGKQLIQGSRGHHSGFLRKPIIKGRFYMEIIGHQPEKMDPTLQYGPEFRVGVAPADYYFNYPIGQDHSIAYKNVGELVNQATFQKFGEPFEFGDIIGVSINVPETFKNRDKNKINPKNCVTFYKNGCQMGKQLHLLTQDIYVFAVSLYNCAEMEINYEKEKLKYLPEGYSPYYDNLIQPIQYIDKQFRNYQPQVYKTYRKYNKMTDNR